MTEQVAVEPLDYALDGPTLVRALRPLGAVAWLDSGDGRGRHDIITAAPREALLCRSGRTRWRDRRGRWHVHAGDPFELLAERVASRPVAPCGLPFPGGALGYVGYELGYPVVHLPVPAAAPGGLPDMALGIHDWAVIRDHRERSAWLLTLPGAAMDRERLFRLLDAAPEPTGHLIGAVAADLGPGDYAEAFERVMRYIHDGDCYQVNLSRCYRASLQGDPLSAYMTLRARSPAPHAAYLQYGARAVLSISPERFLQVREGLVETRPIKGTRPRHPDPGRDAEAAAELSSSSKDRAENLMIVDLLRNDLGRVCEVGSIRVPELFRAEPHPTVHHLVSTVTGRLPASISPALLLRACFPGGSITGAPKRRAMQIIAELESGPRGVYCGAIGFLGHDGGMDTSIAIRTAVCHHGQISYRAGGGLVSDSRCATEFAETEDKARAFLAMAASGKPASG